MDFILYNRFHREVFTYLCNIPPPSQKFTLEKGNKIPYLAINSLIRQLITHSQPISFNVEQDGKGEQYVSYKPPKFGMYNVAINFGGMPLPNSPYKVKISPKVDASKVKVAGLGKNNELIK